MNTTQIIFKSAFYVGQVMGRRFLKEHPRHPCLQDPVWLAGFLHGADLHEKECDVLKKILKGKPLEVQQQILAMYLSAASN
jgi:hypothetical protein